MSDDAKEKIGFAVELIACVVITVIIYFIFKDGFDDLFANLGKPTIY